MMNRFHFFAQYSALRSSNEAEHLLWKNKGSKIGKQKPVVYEEQEGKKGCK